MEKLSNGAVRPASNVLRQFVDSVWVLAGALFAVAVAAGIAYVLFDTQWIQDWLPTVSVSALFVGLALAVIDTWRLKPQRRVADAAMATLIESYVQEVLVRAAAEQVDLTQERTWDGLMEAWQAVLAQKEITPMSHWPELLREIGDKLDQLAARHPLRENQWEPVAKAATAARDSARFVEANLTEVTNNKKLNAVAEATRKSLGDFEALLGKVAATCPAFSLPLTKVEFVRQIAASRFGAPLQPLFPDLDRDTHYVYRHRDS